MLFFFYGDLEKYWSLITRNASNKRSLKKAYETLTGEKNESGQHQGLKGFIWDAVYYHKSMVSDIDGKPVTNIVKHMENRKVLEINWEQAIDIFQSFMIEVSTKENIHRTKLLCNILTNMKKLFPEYSEKLFGHRLNLMDVFSMLYAKVKRIMLESLPGKIEDLMSSSMATKVFLQKMQDEMRRIRVIAQELKNVVEHLKMYKTFEVDEKRNKFQDHWREMPHPSPSKHLVGQFFSLIKEIEQLTVVPLSTSQQNSCLDVEYTVEKGLFFDQNEQTYYLDAIAEQYHFQTLVAFSFSCEHHEFKNFVLELSDEIDNMIKDFDRVMGAYEESYFNQAHNDTWMMCN